MKSNGFASPWPASDVVDDQGFGAFPSPSTRCRELAPFALAAKVLEDSHGTYVQRAPPGHDEGLECAGIGVSLWRTTDVARSEVPGALKQHDLAIRIHTKFTAIRS